MRCINAAFIFIFEAVVVRGFVSCHRICVPSRHAALKLVDAKDDFGHNVLLDNYVDSTSSDVAFEELRVRVECGPIIEFMPWLKLHHFVILESDAFGGVLVTDFSPAHKSNPLVLLKMLWGGSVPGRLRMHFIQNKDDLSSHLQSDLQQYRSNDAVLCAIEKGLSGDRDLSTTALPTILSSRRLQFILKRISNEWSDEIQLYNHNCQHYSEYCHKLVDNL